MTNHQIHTPKQKDTSQSRQSQVNIAAIRDYFAEKSDILPFRRKKSRGRKKTAAGGK